MTPELDMLRAVRGHHAMVSYAHPRQIAQAAEICQSVVLDNGAFTAWRSGKPHDFPGFRAWAALWLKHPAVDWALIPDVIDGDEAANDSLLTAWDLPAAISVPVFHLHESLDRLERLIVTYPRVALGSSGQYRNPGSPEWWRRIAEVMRVACDGDGMPRCKLHGLRMLDPRLFSHLPLASADSCNVARNIGLDKAWIGPYVPASKSVRAIIMMDRIESHASAHRWCADWAGVQQDLDLFG